MKSRLLFCISLFWIINTKFAYTQSDTEFWFVAPEVSKGASFFSYDHPVLFRFSTYALPATVTVSQPANPTFPLQTIFIPAGSGGEVQIPLSLLNAVENRPPNQVLNKGFLIQSTNPITAYYEVLGVPSDNPEIFALKGKNALGTDFFIPFQNILTNSNDYSPSPHAAFDIVATTNNTLVTITPAKPIVGHAANVPFNITLQRGQSYSAEASGQSGPAHPAGSRVVSNKPIAITVKDDLLDGSPIFGGFCDDLVGDQIVPIDKIGTQYVVQKGFLNGNERAFVLATAANTQVSLDGVAQGTLNASQTLELTITGGNHFIKTSAPVYLYQLTGVNCEVSGVILPALDCTGSSAVRFVRTTDEDFSLFLVTKSGQEDGFILNGNPNLISGLSFQTVPGSNGEYVGAVLPYSTTSVPAGQSSVVENTLGTFQMGFLNGGIASGCRFGYFSDFSNQVALSHPLSLCPNSSITLNGVTYTQPTTVLDTIPGIQGCDTVVTYILRYAPVDLTFRMDSLRCMGGRIDLDYTLCNLGSDALPPQVSVAFYLGNPLSGPAQYLGSFVPIMAGADSCLSGVLQDLGGALQYDGSGSLYAVVNTDGSLPTPFTTTDLPPTGIAECNYDNNLDSMTAQLPAPPLLDLGPDVVLCLDSTVVFDAGPGFAKYLWHDGSTGASFATSDPGEYWVEVADSCGGVQRDSVVLTRSLLPDTQFPDAALCPGDSLALSAPGFDQYLWSPAAGLSCTDCPVVNIRPDVTTTYTLLATTGTGCELRDTFTVEVLPLPTRAETLEFCPGKSVVIGGITYTQPGTVLDTIPGIVGCDTVVTYTLTFLPLPTRAKTLAFCPGKSVIIGGVTYTQPGTVLDTIPGIAGCDTVVTYTLTFLPLPTRAETLAFCPGKSVIIGGITYTQPGTVLDTIPGIVGCDTVVTYTLTLLPLPTRAETISFCPGKSVIIGGITYTQPGTVLDTIPGIIGCDTVVTYTLTFLPRPTRSETLAFCPGKSVIIGGVTYTQPGTVLDTIPGIIGCDTVVTYTLTFLPLPTRAETVEFCPGASVVIGGVTYTQPGTVLDTIPGIVGCDTIVTYTLVHITSPNAAVTIDCPSDVNIATPSGTGSVAVQYDLPVATSDCPCPGVALTLTEGLPSGSLFPVDKTRVCYEARDSCGNADTCCFFVIVREALPCDVKEIGCMKYELLRITQNAKLERSYRIRVTNKCANPLTYVAIQLPNGVTAVKPAHLSVYNTPPGNRPYEVRNPNFSPFYSIRFKSITDSIANGESDIFEYTLPQQSAPDYIHITARLEPQVFYEAHLNTFYCPVLPENKPAPAPQKSPGLRVFPNPTGGVLYADLSAWADRQLQVQVFDARGQRVLVRSLTADATAQEIVLPDGLADGLYFLEVLGADGVRETVRFVVAR